MKYSTEEIIGQKFILGLDKGIQDSEIKLLIQKYKIGGFILYSKNYNNYEEMVSYIKKLKKYNKANKIPLFISIDQEGGRVNRFPGDIRNSSRAFTLAKTNKVSIIKKSAEFTGELLNKTGINLNFAPVLDIKRYNNDHVIGDRSFGKSRDEVIKYAIPYLKEINKYCISTIKHFPGQGLVKKDSHILLPKVKSYASFTNDLMPFEKAIKNGADSIMIGHILIKDINKNYPIAFSKDFIKNNIRNKYNYNGLIISDELKMKSIYLRYNLNKLIKLAFNNDLDIILMKYTAKDKNKLNNMYRLYNNNLINKEVINNSFLRILDIKNKYNLNDNISYRGINKDKYNKEIIEFRQTYENIK